MMNLNVWLRCWKPHRNIRSGVSFSFFFLFCWLNGYSQFKQSLSSEEYISISSELVLSNNDGVTYRSFQEENLTDTVPEPGKVMLRSVMIPGWGQITNRQVWKVPIIYGLLGGITYYGITLHINYTDYRAAFYNTHSDDERFGPTPETIDPVYSPQALREYRNLYRNRRDFAIIGVFLAYGLNIADAYVFAHFRDFDVSDDLSANVNMNYDFAPDNTPYASLSLRLKF